jgi:hypothetical protein
MKTVYHDGDGVIRPVVKFWDVQVNVRNNVLYLGRYYGTWDEAVKQASDEHLKFSEALYPLFEL